jgi:hypothetical protein
MPPCEGCTTSRSADRPYALPPLSALMACAGAARPWLKKHQQALAHAPSGVASTASHRPLDDARRQSHVRMLLFERWQLARLRCTGACWVARQQLPQGTNVSSSKLPAGASKSAWWVTLGLPYVLEQ